MASSLQPPRWDLTPAAPPTAVRIARSDTRTALMTINNAGQLLQLGAGATSDSPPIDLDFALSISPDFDLAADGDTLLLATEEFEGGTNALRIGQIAGGKFQETASYRGRHHYRHPRFVKNSSNWVTVAATDRVVLLPCAADDSSQQAALQGVWFRVLGDGAAGIAIAHEAVTPSSRMTSLLLQPADVPGEWFHGDPPAYLELQRPDGARSRPFDDLVLFNFDLDVIEQDAVLLAQTARGPLAAHLDLATGIATGLPSPADWSSSSWIASPSVRAVTSPDGVRSFAVAGREGTDDKVLGLRTATISLG